VEAVDEPELADLDPFALMAAEAARIDRFYAGLSEGAWRAPTRCAGWSRRDLLAHLAGVEDYTRAGLRNEVQALFAESATAGLDSFNAWGIGRRSQLSTVELLADWRELVAANDAALRERGPRATMDTSIGQYPIGRQAFYLACERAIHADDAGVPVTTDEREARLDWRLRFGRSALTESRHGGAVTVVSERGGHTVRLGDDEARLTDEHFVEALSGRLPDPVNVPATLRQALDVLS